MKVKIDKLRYFECGKPAPKNSRFKGIMKGETLSEYSDYTGRDEAKENEQELEKHNGYFKYTQSHHLSKTRTSEGILDTEEKTKNFQKMIKTYFRNDGDLAWENVLSIADDKEAERIGLYTIEDWENVLNKALPKFFKYAGFEPDNMFWWWDLHVNKFHPHVHIIFMEKNKTKTQGYLPPKQLQALKRYTALEFEARKKLCEKIDTNYNDFFKKKDIKMQSILKQVDTYLSQDIQKDILTFYKTLPKSGRLQYNSYHMRNHKKQLDKIIEKLITSNDEIKIAYDDWMNDIDLLEDNINEIQNSQISTFKESEMNKLYTRIGNRILRNYKTYYSYNHIHNNISVKKNPIFQRYPNNYNSYSNSNQVLGAYCMSIIHKQQQEMEESLREFLRINGLEM